MKEWKQIDSALNAEIESFDEFMTAKKIDGAQKETFTNKEVQKVKKILEKPLPERLIQEKLLEHHMAKRE